MSPARATSRTTSCSRASNRCYPLRDKQVVLYCRSGRRTQLAADVLQKAGFKRLAHLEGDYLAWEAQQRPIERSAAAAKP